FSSRRRHTRSLRDWSSDVCSSDLGLKVLMARSDANARAIAGWVARTPWIDFLAQNPAVRSNTSVCLKVVDPAVLKLSADAQAARSEERRVGKECRCRLAPSHDKTR